VLHGDKLISGSDDSMIKALSGGARWCHIYLQRTS
jgi:hypothetical protein